MDDDDEHAACQGGTGPALPTDIIAPRLLSGSTPEPDIGPHALVRLRGVVAEMAESVAVNTAWS